MNKEAKIQAKMRTATSWHRRVKGATKKISSRIARRFLNRNLIREN